MMRRALGVPALLLALWPATPTAAASCRFELGFAALAARLPAQVGVCLEDEQHDAMNGDATQHTTSGLLVWRKADNWTAFTNGYLTWVHGPYGIVRRLNTQRFLWEANPEGLPIAQDAGTHTSSIVNVTSTSSAQGATSNASNVTSYQIDATQTSENGSTMFVMQSGGNGSDASSTSGSNSSSNGAGSVVTSMVRGANGASSAQSVQQQGAVGASTQTGNVAVQGTSSPSSNANGGTSNADGTSVGR